MNTTTENTLEQLTALGFSLEILAGPIGEVDADKKEGWPHIAYTVALNFKGKRCLATPYKLGVGHVDPKKVRTGTASTAIRFSDAEIALLRSWQNNPSASFMQKQIWANTAAKIAIAQKVQPTLPDVLHSLLMDGEAFFNAQSFEDWASNFGYDADSRKAESIYRACDAIGRKLAATIPENVLSKAREILQDY